MARAGHWQHPYAQPTVGDMSYDLAVLVEVEAGSSVPPISAGPPGSLPVTGLGGGLVLLGIVLVVAGVLARVVAR